MGHMKSDHFIKELITLIMITNSNFHCIELIKKILINWRGAMV